MNIYYTRIAAEQLSYLDERWRRRNKDSPDRFAYELAELQGRLVSEPGAAECVETFAGYNVRMLEFQTTGHRVYFVFDTARRAITVFGLWGPWCSAFGRDRFHRAGSGQVESTAASSEADPAA